MDPEACATIVSTFAKLSLLENVSVPPVESLRTSVPSPPSITSLSASPAVVITIMSSPVPPVIISEPPPPVIVSSPSPALIVSPWVLPTKISDPSAPLIKNEPEPATADKFIVRSPAALAVKVAVPALLLSLVDVKLTISIAFNNATPATIKTSLSPPDVPPRSLMVS